MRNIAFLVFIVAFFAGCTSTYQYDFDENSAPLEQDKNIAIAVSNDGFYGTDVYAGSGRTLSNEIKIALKPYANKSTIVRNLASLEDFSDEEESYEIITAPEDFSKVLEALEAAKVPMLEADVTMIPQTYVELTDETDIKNINKTLDLLDDDDDVQNVYHNWDE